MSVVRYTRTAERRRQVAHARQYVAAGVGSGDPGLIAAGLAELVRQPGGRHGRRYVPGGANKLGESVPPWHIPGFAMSHPVAVTPSYAYAIVDVDYDRASSDAVRVRMRDQVDDLLALVRPCGVPAVRIPSGATCGEWANEHVWLVTGHHTLRLDNRQRLAQLVTVRCPDLQIMGGLKDGRPDAQLVRPPGSRHRSGCWPPLDRPVQVLETLAAAGPAADGWALLLRRLRDPPAAGAAAGARRSPRATVDGTAPADWARRLLEDGPEADADRSVEGCRLIGHLLSRGWDVERITGRLLDSPAVDYLRDRLGRVELATRVRDDVVRIAGKHRRGTRRPLPRVVQAAASHWDLIELPDGTRPRWLTQSGRVVLGALAAEAARTGFLTVGASQRTVAVAAGVSARTVGRTYRRWAAHGAVQLDLDDHGQVAAVTIEPAVVERLLPGDLTATLEIHTPLGSPAVWGGAVHDAWVHRPCSTGCGVPRLGAAARRAWVRLGRLGAVRAAELADELGWARVYARRVLGRLAAHGLVWERPEGRWTAVEWPWAADLLEVAARRLGTDGVLAQRRVRYTEEQAQRALLRRALGEDRGGDGPGDPDVEGAAWVARVRPDEGGAGIRGPTRPAEQLQLQLG